jgi:alpha-L-rhamnosidase
LDLLKSFQNPATRLINPPGWRISEYAGGNMPNDGYNIATACQYYENLRIASRIFSVLRQTGQSDTYSQEAEAVKAGINANLFNGEYYLARTDRKEMFPLAQAWSLRFGIEPPAQKSKILEVIEKAGKPNIGGYGGDAFYSGMLNGGGGAFVVNDLARYRPMLDSNKACWEQWNLGGEVNHAWTSYPGYLFLKYICGIQPTSGGFATFDVRPEPGGLAFAEGSVPTPKGPITARWEKSELQHFILSIHVPANTRATIYLPKPGTDSFTIEESGKLLWPVKSRIEIPGILAVEEEDSRVKCQTGAGDYRFSELPATP